MPKRILKTCILLVHVSLFTSSVTSHAKVRPLIVERAAKKVVRMLEAVHPEEQFALTTEEQSNIARQFRLLMEEEAGAGQYFRLTQEEVIAVAKQVEELGFPMGQSPEWFKEIKVPGPGRWAKDGDLDIAQWALAQKLITSSSEDSMAMRITRTGELLYYLDFDAPDDFIEVVISQMRIAELLKDVKGRKRRTVFEPPVDTPAKITPVLTPQFTWTPPQRLQNKKELNLGKEGSLTDALNILAQTPTGTAIVEKTLELMEEGSIEITPMRASDTFSQDSVTQFKYDFLTGRRRVTVNYRYPVYVVARNLAQTLFRAIDAGHAVDLARILPAGTVGRTDRKENKDHASTAQKLFEDEFLARYPQAATLQPANAALPPVSSQTPNHIASEANCRYVLGILGIKGRLLLPPSASQE